ncbi:hypothetical protein ACVJBD_007458 [Rhizobium mongolense]
MPAITPCMSVFVAEVARPTLVFRGLLGRAEPILITGGRAVSDYREAFDDKEDRHSQSGKWPRSDIAGRECLDVSASTPDRQEKALSSRACVNANSRHRMEGTDPPDSPLSNVERSRKEVDGGVHGSRAGTRWLHVGNCKGGPADLVINSLRLTSSRIGGGGTTAGECPFTALWPARATPAVRQEQPRTHNRECGSQPAYQSLITDVLQFRSTNARLLPAVPRNG